MIKTNLIFFVLLSLALAGYALPSTDWQYYPYTPDGSLISFAVDEGVHDDILTTMEWWYMNFMLIGGPPDYNVYTGMLCYFRPLPLRIINIGNVSTGEFYENAIPALGTYTFAAGHLELTYDYALLGIHDFWRWTYPTDSKTFKYTLSATNPLMGCALNLTIASNKSPLIVGGDGWVGLGGGSDSSFYYSLSNMRATGSVDCGFLHDTVTSGIVWLDRQWGPFLVDPESHYEWYSIQVDEIGATLGEPTPNSAEINIWQLFADSVYLPSGPTGYMTNIRLGDNYSDTTSQFIFERLGYWKDPLGERYFSHGWRYIDTLHNTCLEYFPMIENQMVTVAIMRYWEGGCYCSGVANGISVEGYAFSELPRRTSYMITPPSTPTGLSATPMSEEIVLTWHSAEPGTYPVGGYRIYRASADMVYGNYLATTTDTFFTDPAPPGSFRYWVSSFDNQSGVSASRRAGPVEVIQVGIISDIAMVSNFEILTYPNPFNGAISIELAGVGTDYNLSIDIYDINGRMVTETPAKPRHASTAGTAGVAPTTHEYIWSPDESVVSGIYFVRVNAGDKWSETKKVIYLK